MIASAKLTGRWQAAQVLGQQGRVVRVRARLRLVDVPKELHLQDAYHGGVVVLLVAAELVLVLDAVEELRVAADGEAEDLPDDARHALVSGFEREHRRLRWGANTSRLVKRGRLFSRSLRLTILPPALPPARIILSGSTPSEDAFALHYCASSAPSPSCKNSIPHC